MTKKQYKILSIVFIILAFIISYMVLMAAISIIAVKSSIYDKIILIGLLILDIPVILLAKHYFKLSR